MTDTAECVECGADVTLPADAEIGAIADCRTSGTALEVVGLEPVALELEADRGE